MKLLKKVTASLKLSDINMTIDTEEMFVTEMLVSFDQFLTFTMTGLWNCYLITSHQTTAGLKLKSKMKAMEIMNATMATAQALEKATENASIQKATSLETNLRIANLEKSARKQEQTSNEIINQMKAKTTQPQNNLKGRHPMESVTSPDKWTPSTRKNKTKRNLVDLTLE
jgi:redox-regulated HSP33 family molecular chaperone